MAKAGVAVGRVIMVVSHNVAGRVAVFLVSASLQKE